MNRLVADIKIETETDTWSSQQVIFLNPKEGLWICPKVYALYQVTDGQKWQIGAYIACGYDACCKNNGKVLNQKAFFIYIRFKPVICSLSVFAIFAGLLRLEMLDVPTFMGLIFRCQ